MATEPFRYRRVTAGGDQEIERKPFDRYEHGEQLKSLSKSDEWNPDRVCELFQLLIDDIHELHRQMVEVKEIFDCIASEGRRASQSPPRPVLYSHVEDLQARVTRLEQARSDAH